MENYIVTNGCPICGKQSLSASNPYCKDHTTFIESSIDNTIENTIYNTFVSVNKLESTVGKLTLRMETLNKENIATTENMCQYTYQLAMENTERHIKDVYCSLNWFQRLLWRILGLNRLWLNDEY